LGGGGGVLGGGAVGMAPKPPTPKPQSPIPNPQDYFISFLKKLFNINKLNIFFNIRLIFI